MIHIEHNMELVCISEFLSNLYTMSTVFFTVFFLHCLTLVRVLAGLNPKPANCRLITAAEFLKLIDDTSPPDTFVSAGVRSPETAPAPECRVCLSEFEDGEGIRRLRCGHVFHKECLDTWLQECCATCPLCRGKVLPDDVVAGHMRMRNEDEFDGNEEELLFFLSALHSGNSFHRLYF